MNPLKIMFLEDKPILRLDIQTCLEYAGYEVWAVSSEEAIWLVCQEQHPDVAILNVHFHQQADGLTLAGLLSRRFPIRVYFITGAYLSKAALGGLSGLRKPFTRRQLGQFLAMLP